jgi:predicted outer membrane repeat protein
MLSLLEIMFIGNLAVSGGSLYLFESIVILNGINTFLNNNSSKQYMDCNCTYTLQLTDIDFRFYSLKGCGGAIVCVSSSLVINSEYSVFASNSALNSGGAIIAIDHGSITIIGSALFERNIAHKQDGGAIRFNGKSMILQGNISFRNNEASLGGALSLVRGTLNISSSKGWWSLQYFYSTITSFLDSRNVVTSEKSVDSNNISTPIAADYDHSTSVFDSVYKNTSLVGIVKFCGNVETEKGGAISIWSFGHMNIATNTYFENNTAHDGGGLFFFATSKLVLFPEITISFVQNRAESRGGAIYFQEDSRCLMISRLPARCTLRLRLSINSKHYAMSTISLHFLKNSAGVAGSTLYGGKLNKCRLCHAHGAYKYYYRDICHCSGCALALFMNISRIVQHNESGSATNISSQAEIF